MKSKTIQENIEWTIDQAMTLAKDARQKPPKERSGYYKASLWFCASAIEAMVFLLVKNFHNASRGGIYPTETNYALLHTLPTNLFNKMDGTIGIYAKTTKQFLWKDDVDFNTLNQITKNNNICNKKLHNNLEKIRKQRNRIHIQSLQQTDHRYTQKDVENAQSVIANLFPLVTT